MRFEGRYQKAKEGMKNTWKKFAKSENSPLFPLGNYESTFGLYHFSGLYHFLMWDLHHFRHGLYQFLAYIDYMDAGLYQFLVHTSFWSTPYFGLHHIFMILKSGMDQKVV